MEAERDSLYKAIGYTKGEDIQPFSKEVFAVLSIYSICGVVVILSCVYCLCICSKFTRKPIIWWLNRTADPETFP